MWYVHVWADRLLISIQSAANGCTMACTIQVCLIPVMHVFPNELLIEWCKPSEGNPPEGKKKLAQIRL